jgi:hypothetical protein
VRRPRCCIPGLRLTHRHYLAEASQNDVREPKFHFSENNMARVIVAQLRTSHYRDRDAEHSANNDTVFDVIDGRSDSSTSNVFHAENFCSNSITTMER